MHPRSLGEENGGYVTSYDADGAFADTDEKRIVTQSRMVCSSPDPPGQHGHYKGAYHNGRALIESIEELEAMALE